MLMHDMTAASTRTVWARRGIAKTRSGNILDARGIILEIGRKRILDDVSIRLPPRTLTVIMGPNGAGKSQMLRVLHGLQQPTSGEIFWGDARMSHGNCRQAMVFQKPVLLRRSVAANIDYVLPLKGQERADRRQAILESVGLAPNAGQPARLLSGGEQQRLALARALATEPEVLFLDEPTASLDPASVARIEDIVLQVHESGTKVVFVTHDIGQARRLGDDVVFLNQGRITEHSEAARFFDEPASAEARAYLDGQIVL